MIEYNTKSFIEIIHGLIIKTAVLELHRETLEDLQHYSTLESRTEATKVNRGLLEKSPIRYLHLQK